MRLERYTPEICSELSKLAETRSWSSWSSREAREQDLLEEIELTYHLHVAAEANGTRRGLPPMPQFPVRMKIDLQLLDPARFLSRYSRRY